MLPNPTYPKYIIAKSCEKLNGFIFGSIATKPKFSSLLELVSAVIEIRKSKTIGRHTIYRERRIHGYFIKVKKNLIFHFFLILFQKEVLWVTLPLELKSLWIFSGKLDCPEQCFLLSKYINTSLFMNKKQFQ